MENSFVDNLRNAFKGYESAAKSDLMKRLEREWSAENVRRNGVGAIGSALQGVGVGTAINSWKGGPAFGIPGSVLGAGLALAGGSAAVSSEKYHTSERRRIFDAMQKEATNQWTKYKNDAIKKSSGGKYTVEKLAKEGKMVTDDGDIVDIDYDYYKTVPYETLNRVFGKAGAEAVRKKMSGEE